MVAYYKIAGQSIGSHWLAIATLSTMFVGSWAAMPAKKPGGQGPPINAKDGDEEKFIQEFIKSAEQEDSKAKQGSGQ